MSEVIKNLLTNPLSSPIYWIFILTCITVIIILKIYGKKIIGFFGEHHTREALRRLPKDKYKIINDVFINVNGKTSQIDHVIISCYGYFLLKLNNIMDI